MLVDAEKRLWHRTASAILGIALVLVLVSLWQLLGDVHLPGNHVGYSPEQPIAYSHRLHAGELEIPCLYCHFGAEKSRHAGVPSADVCMNCHKFVTAPLIEIRSEEKRATLEKRPPANVVSSEIQKLYDALGLDENRLPDPGKTPTPIVWTQVHRVPDYVYFDHRPHVHAGVRCQSCHGDVEMMEKVYQVESLSMGWCVNCHRQETPATPGVALASAPAGGPRVSKHVSTDCAVCHY